MFVGLCWIVDLFAPQESKPLMPQESARDERRMFETYDVCVCVLTVYKIVTLYNIYIKYIYIIIYNVISYNMNLYMMYSYTVIVMICFAYLIMQYN